MSTKIIEITIDELMDELKKEGNIDRGGSGIVNDYNEDTLIKIYYSQVYRGYKSKKMYDLIKAMELNKVYMNNSKLSNMIGLISKESLLTKCERLANTRSNIIKGIVLCEDYPIGVLLEKYIGYTRLNKIYSDLPRKEKVEYLSKARELVIELMDHEIYPTDMEDNNLMVNRDNGDVKVIDLDDNYTRLDPGCCSNIRALCLRFIDFELNEFKKYM